LVIESPKASSPSRHSADVGAGSAGVIHRHRSD
jgi:hypothetical protein